jgi:predicted nuclease of predicted toxin-antitoxin system
MRVLFDNGTPRGVAKVLSDHVVVESREHGWDTLRNGELLDSAERSGYDVFVTTDRNIKHQQNLTGLKIAIVVLGAARWRLIKNKLAEIAVAVSAATPGSFTEVEIPNVL